MLSKFRGVWADDFHHSKHLESRIINQPLHPCQSANLRRQRIPRSEEIWIPYRLCSIAMKSAIHAVEMCVCVWKMVYVFTWDVCNTALSKEINVAGIGNVE